MQTAATLSELTLRLDLFIKAFTLCYAVTNHQDLKTFPLVCVQATEHSPQLFCSHLFSVCPFYLKFSRKMK